MDAQGQPGAGPTPGAGGGGPRGGDAGPLEPAGPGFVQGLLEIKATVAFVLATIGIFYFCVQAAGGELRTMIGPQIAERFGGYTYEAVRDRGEWWRFFTTLFVATNAITAFFYVYLFVSMARQVERVLGTMRFVAMYFIAGAGAVALNEIFGLRLRAYMGGDVMVAVYALFGAVPGLVLGMTGDVGATLKHPSSTGAFFYAAFLTVVTWIQFKAIDPAPVIGMVLAFVVTAGLMSMRRGSKAGYAGVAAGLLLTALGVAGVSKGLVWREGKLVDRGRGVSTPGRPGPQPPPETDPQQPPPSNLGTQAEASDAAQEVLKRVKPFLDRFGPLPIDEGITLADRQEAEGLLADVRKVADGPNLVVGELDEERVLLCLLASNMHEALRVANDHVTLVKGEREAMAHALALRGLVGLWLGGGQLEQAFDDLDAAAGTSGYSEKVPEVLFHYGAVIKAKTGDEEGARAQFQRYVRMVADGPHPEWRKRMVQLARERGGM